MVLGRGSVGVAYTTGCELVREAYRESDVSWNGGRAGLVSTGPVPAWFARRCFPLELAPSNTAMM
jgi:hypothetical protein